MARLRIVSLLLCLSLVFLSAVAPTHVHADDAVAATSAHEQSLQNPNAKFVQNLGSHAISIIANKKMSPEQRNGEFSKIMNDSFDLKTIGRFVIGRTWNSATPAQQQEYMDLFKALIIKTYGNRLTLYTGEGFEVIGARAESEMDTTVNSQITHPDGSKPTLIDWRIRTKDGKMGVIDVVVEGVSLSVTQRQEYTSIIQNNGGQIDALLKEMRNELNAAEAPTENHG